MSAQVPNVAAPNPAAAPNGGVSAAAPAAPWYGEISDADLKGFVELKKPSDATTALKGWRDAEKFIGVPQAELLRLPKDLGAAKPEDLNPVYDRLGRPAKPEDYKIDQAAGDESFTNAMRPVLHSIGMSQRQVDALVPAWNQYVKTQYEGMEREQEQKEQIDLQNLHREWPGETFTQREEMARRAVREFVMPIAGDSAKAEELLGNIEEAVGTATFLKLFSGIGEKVGEAKFVSGDRGSQTFGMTPAAAQAQLDQNMQDKEWSKAVFNKKQPQYGEWDRLVTLAAQGRGPA